MSDLGSRITEMERLLRECRTYLKADKYAEYPHLIARIDAAINAEAANEDVDTGRGHTEAQDNLPAAPAPTASPPPATAKPISCALRGVGQGGVAGLAPHRRVVCAAIRSAGGDVLLGIRHYSRDMQDQMSRYFSSMGFQHRHDEDQGFVDQHGVYMSREEAYKVALAAGQIIYPKRCGDGLDGKKLYSEGLY